VATGVKSQVKSHWQRTILVCSKCSKKLGGGFGKNDGQSLAKALRGHLGLKRGRKAPIGIVEVKCLGICPRGAVTMVDAAEPGRWQLVEKGTALAQVAEALALHSNEAQPAAQA
jgi:predicted metal-binding protein